MAWVLAVVFAIIAIGLLFKIMGDASRVNEIREERDEAKKDARRMAEKIKDMEGKLTSKSQEAGTSKDQKKQVQEAEAAKRTAEAAKKSAEEDKTKVEDRNRELSAELQRVRIEKEQQRQELFAARERLRELGETASQIEKLKAEKADALAAAEKAASRVVETPAAAPDPEREERLSKKLEKDLEAKAKSVERLEGALERWKQKAIESESAHRRLQKRFGDSSLMWNITQSQLDLALDEIYTLRHGAPPEHPQTDKHKKRASLKPATPTVEVKPGPVVVLPDARPSEGYRDETAEAEAAAPAPSAEPAVTAVKAEAPAKVEAPAKAEPPKVEAPAKAEAPPKVEAPAKAEPPKVEAPAKAEPPKADDAKPAAKAAKKADGEQKPVLRKKEPEEAPAAAKAETKAEAKADPKTDKKAPPRPKAAKGK